MTCKQLNRSLHFLKSQLVLLKPWTTMNMHGLKVYYLHHFTILHEL